MGTTCTRREVVRLLGFSLLAAACGQTAQAPRPEEVALGRDECAWCRMLIDDARHAAELVRAGGRTEKFGEPGCLLAWLAEHRDSDGVSYVMVEDGRWLRAGDAWFTVGRTRTPMSFDIVAHRTAPADSVGAAWHDLLLQGVPRVRPS